MSAFTSDSVLWYFNRATGTVSLLMLTVVTVLGLAVAGRAPRRAATAALVVGVHRAAALLSVTFLAVHITAAVADSYVDISWVAAFVPFVSTYQPLWLGLGAVAVDLLLAVVVTSLLRARIGRRAWRAVHWAAYASWPVAVVHGLTMGTDLAGGLLLGLTILAIGAVVGTAAWRWRSGSDPVRAPLRSGVAAGHRVAARSGTGR